MKRLRASNFILCTVSLSFATWGWPHAQHDVFVEGVGQQQNTVLVGLSQDMAQQPRLIEVEKVQFTRLAITVRTDAVVQGQPWAKSELNVNASGEVRKVWVRKGQHTQRGDPIVSIYSPEFILTQKAHLTLLTNEARLEQIRQLGNLTDYLQDARENLLWWGMTEEEIERLIKDRELKQLLVFRAPVSGVVTDVLVEPGSLVNAGEKGMSEFVVSGAPVCRIAPHGMYWIEARVFAQDLPRVRVGQAARVRLVGDRQWLGGRVALVDARLREDDLRARVYIMPDERPERISPGAPAQVQIVVGHETAVWLPAQAVLSPSYRPFVYVRQAPDVFERRQVEVGDRHADRVHVHSGVKAGEEVVVRGALMLEGRRLMNSGNSGAHH